MRQCLHQLRRRRPADGVVDDDVRRLVPGEAPGRLTHRGQHPQAVLAVADHDDEVGLAVASSVASSTRLSSSLANGTSSTTVEGAVLQRVDGGLGQRAAVASSRKATATVDRPVCWASLAIASACSESLGAVRKNRSRRRELVQGERRGGRRAGEHAGASADRRGSPAPPSTMPVRRPRRRHASTSASMPSVAPRRRRRPRRPATTTTCCPSTPPAALISSTARAAASTMPWPIVAPSPLSGSSSADREHAVVDRAPVRSSSCRARRRDARRRGAVVVGAGERCRRAMATASPASRRRRTGGGQASAHHRGHGRSVAFVDGPSATSRRDELIADRTIGGRDLYAARWPTPPTTSCVALRRCRGRASPARRKGSVALVAVGGYGRNELAPFSDIDVLLVHDGRPAGIEELAAALWYPLWDSGLQLGHAVRSLDQQLARADEDLDAATAQLSARLVAGDEELGRPPRRRGTDALAAQRAPLARRPAFPGDRAPGAGR